MYNLFEEEISELFKSSFASYFLLVSIILFVAPISNVDAAHEFTVYRMQQFDYNSVSYGCRSASVNLEVRSLVSWSTARHCIVTWLLEMSVDQYKLLSNKAGCVLLILPRKMHLLKPDEKTMILLLEKYMMSTDTLTPIYFAHWSPELDKIASDVNTERTAAQAKETAFQALINSVAANGYQLVINVNKPTPVADVQIPSVYGTLAGLSTAEADKLPTIILLAHYDTFGVAPELSFGLDNNGSGMIALLELVRIFSHLYSSARSHARYNLVFVLTGGGKYNFLATKKFLDDEIEELKNVEFVLCLESLAKSSENINFFLSKPPKPGTPIDKFYKIFSRVASSSSPNVSVAIKHKKINLQEAWLAWEHEHFSMRKYTAFTLSTLESNKDIQRNTILDTKENLDVPTLIRNIEILAESVADYVYDLEDATILKSSIKVEKSSINTYISRLSSEPRNIQLLHPKRSSFPLMNNLQLVLTKYLGPKSVKSLSYVQDKREAELILYSGASYKLSGNVYNVKPVVFDLILLLFIGAYLYAFYFLINQVQNLL